MPLPRIPSLAVLAAAVAACGSGSQKCDPSSQNGAIAATVQDWYLFPELLPAAIDPAAYGTPSALLDALTQAARDQGKDRGWSYVTTVSQTQQFYGAGQSVGFGIVALVRGSQLFLGDVIGGSAAADAGFVRGDEILRIGDTAAALVPVADLLAAAGALSEAYGPSTAGVTRVLEVRTQAGATEQRTVTKRAYSLDPVPAVAIVPRTGSAPAGYLALRTFIGTAEAPLRQAFADFQAAGVTDVVVDLRYNGGGLVSLAELLADLLGRDQAGKLMYSMQFNARHASSGSTTFFGAVSGAMAPARIAFVTSGATASASELVPNVLDPYASVALVGSQTYGKPVGQISFQDTSCDLALFLISFRLVNSAGDADYYGGLPDAGFRGPLCPAADDLTQPQDSPLEASTAAALYWLENGTCPPPPVAARAIPPTVFPRAARPTPAQVDMPGLF